MLKKESMPMEKVKIKNSKIKIKCMLATAYLQFKKYIFIEYVKTREFTLIWVFHCLS
jgi:hypothetical protein